MDCREALKILEEEIDGRNAAAVSAELRAHLGACPSCAAEEAALRQVGEIVRHWTTAGAAARAPEIEALWTRVKGRIDERRRAAGLRRRLLRWLFVPAAAAALAASVLLFYPSDGKQAPFRPRTFEVAVESIESEDATVALVEGGEDLPTVIWIMEDGRT